MHLFGTMKVTINYRMLSAAILLVLFAFTYICFTDISKELSERQITQKMVVYIHFAAKEVINFIWQTDKRRYFILYTPTCKIPKLDPFDYTITRFYEPKEILDCKGRPLFLSTNPGGSISLNKVILQMYYHIKPEDLFCIYRGIPHNDLDYSNMKGKGLYISNYDLLRYDVPLNHDNVEVKCYYEDKEKTFEQFTHYFPLVNLKKNVENIKSKISPTVPKLNVIILGIDSVSKLNFLRHLPGTEDFLKTKGNWFEMKGYVTTGNDTLKNLMVLLTGRRNSNKMKNAIMSFEEEDLIWNKYAEYGYRTLYAEDSYWFSLLNNRSYGFDITPTDYYLGTRYLATPYSPIRNKDNLYCMNSLSEPEIMYNYLVDFAKTMDSRHYFAFSFTSALTYDDLNYAGYMDFPTEELLDDLWNAGVYDNTMLVLFSDYGIRDRNLAETYIGQYEERMPFLYIHFPTSFLEHYPRFNSNLHNNTNRLTTLFDVYATMVHVLNFSKKQKPFDVSQQGLSLLHEISPYRTCQTAGIDSEFCLC